MKLGITQTFECSYLADQQEQLLVLLEDNLETHQYEDLIRLGFRRSGEQIYRPHCASCNACQSVRVPVDSFSPSRSQKRLLNKNKAFEISVSDSNQDEYYGLYEKYIELRHSDGSMYPPNRPQYESFVEADWLQQMYLEVRLADRLIAVAVTDVLLNGLSALYTFFDPDFEDHSLGNYLILQQIEKAREMGKQYVYLGYQIDACQKMNYKVKFLPHERFYEQNWHRITKKID
jgi:arginine-tRNA-protein transferase